MRLCKSCPLDIADEFDAGQDTISMDQGKMCCGRTPIETMIEGKEIWREKFVN